jgi:two-component system, cell cycle sensor histidine kinase and response regulator CckA
MSVPLRVLMIEDSQDDALLLLRQLQHGGYDVTWHRVETQVGMQDALAREAWDVVICDYSMPHFGGFDALRILRGQGLDTPFIFLSGTLEEDVAISALRQGAQDYIMKGSTKRLLPAIERELKEAVQRKEHALLERRVRHLERFEAIGKLAGGIAHDFNNLMGVILNSAELGEEQAAEHPIIRERFRTISRQSKLAANLTHQLLAFARKQILKPERIDLNSAISRIEGVLSSSLEANIHFKCCLDPDIDVVEADPSQIEQVILNLCLNARDAMPGGGTLVVKTMNIELDEEFCRMHAYGFPGSYVMLIVSDNGTGMDAGTQGHMFEPFFTTKKMGKGTGLGLATVYGIVKQHNGFINVYSEIDQGTTFRIYLPAVNDSQTPKPAPARTKVVPSPSAGTETILVAEDNPALVELAKELLGSRGYTVIAARDGWEAVQLFRERVDEIGLVILDVVMPNVGGPEAFDRMAAIRPDVPVIFTSGHTAETTALISRIRTGAFFLQKPYTPQLLVESARMALDKTRIDKARVNRMA